MYIHIYINLWQDIQEASEWLHIWEAGMETYMGDKFGREFLKLNIPLFFLFCSCVSILLKIQFI